MGEINSWDELEDGLNDNAGIVATALHLERGGAVAYSRTFFGGEPVIHTISMDTLEEIMEEIAAADEHWENPEDDGSFSERLLAETEQGPWCLIGCGVYDSDGKFVGINEGAFAAFVADFALLLE